MMLSLSSCDRVASKASLVMMVVVARSCVSPVLRWSLAMTR